nr:hypothetical protein [Allomuricauda sp.]
MQRHYKEKALLATKYKIENLERDSGFFRRNFWKVTAFGVFFSIWAPSFTDMGGNTVMYRLGMSFFESALVSGGVYLTFCLLGHFIWTYQEKEQMKRLLRRKAKLEEEIASMTNTKRE